MTLKPISSGYILSDILVRSDLECSGTSVGYANRNYLVGSSD